MNVREDQTCGHCGATDVGSYEAGYASAGDTPLCHPNARGRSVCYNLVTLYKHAMPCQLCTALRESRRSVQAPADHPYADPGDGRSECDVCGKFVWPVTHSCKGVPVTEAAMGRFRSRMAQL